MTDIADPLKNEPGNPAAGSSIIQFDRRDFPWWLVAMLAIIALLVVAIAFSEDYQEAYFTILPGLTMTIVLTIVAFLIATVLGLLIGLGRLSKNAVIRNTATLYIEFVRGIPFLVFIFVVAQVLTPDFADLTNIALRSIRAAWRATAALSLFYAAFIAEVFRAGIQSVPDGQREAGRSVGLSEAQVMRKIVLPQALRNMLPALGNDLIALMKDTSLVSLIAVRELTQLTRLYTGSSFKVREGFFVLTTFYVVLTLLLSLGLRWYERRISIPTN